MFPISSGRINLRKIKNKITKLRKIWWCGRS